jgi:hypothetical protein
MMSMSGTIRLGLLSAASALIVALSATPALADGGVVDPAPIGPGNYFVGEVNNTTGPAVIHMACFGPVTPGQTGHPMSGQSVKALPVAPPVSSLVGYTGTAANSIVVTFGVTSAVTPVILHDWAVPAAIPTTLTLPCYGTGTVTFTPSPTSATARSYTVTVSYVGQP